MSTVKLGISRHGYPLTEQEAIREEVGEVVADAIHLAEELHRLGGEHPCGLITYLVEKHRSAIPEKPQSGKAPIPADLRWQVWERDDFTCKECGGRRYLTIDHIYPESKGGPTVRDNLQTLCKSCNSAKGAKV